MSITRTLLASDLDGTLIPGVPDAKSRRDVGDFVEAVRAAGTIELAYVTGRHLSLARDGVAEAGLPTPSWFVCDVGTSVYRNANGHFELDEGYRRSMRDASGGVDSAHIIAAIGEVHGLRLQEPEKQAEFKVSYYSGARPETILDAVRARLGAAAGSVDLVASFDPVANRGLLDILPAGGAKDRALRYLHGESGVDEDHVVYAGDSGNDRAAMLAGYRAIVVGNAEEGLKRQLREEASRLGLADRLYFAAKPCAAGVLEGLRYFGRLD